MSKKRINVFLHTFCLITMSVPHLASGASSSEKELREYGDRLSEFLRASENGANQSGDRCRIGFIYATEDGVVYSVGDQAFALGIRKGDVIKAFGDVEFDPNDLAFFDKIPVWLKGQDVKLTLQRNGQILEVKGPCPYDAGDFQDAWNRVVPSARKDKPRECLEALNQLDRQFGKSARSLHGRNICYLRYLEKSKWRKGGLSDYSAFVLSQYLFLIEKNSHISGGLEDMKPEILRIQAWLEDRNQHRFSRELGASYEEAINEKRSSAASEAVPAASVSLGTCFAVSSDGSVLTSEHVVSGSSEMTIRFEDGSTFAAALESASSSTDLALLRTDRRSADYLSLAPMRSSRPGQNVFTYGYPASTVLGDEPKFTDGTISALSGPGGEAMLLQISVPIQPGNSGGPLVTDDGQVVGIIAASAAVEPFIRNTGALPQNVNWAVKADYARLMLESVGRPVTSGREEAIERVRRAICQVEARH